MSTELGTRAKVYILHVSHCFILSSVIHELNRADTQVPMISIQHAADLVEHSRVSDRERVVKVLKDDDMSFIYHPGKALYGRGYRSLVGSFNVSEASLIGPELVHQAMEKVKVIQERLKEWRRVIKKSYTDVRRRALEFEVEDWNGTSRVERVERVERTFNGLKLMMKTFRNGKRS
ncbi:hypothetical protein MTR67_039608 [Solanum verrucosum]|uniref:Uncharacterized protein n=1 Tax=Solanum verrucosum TaxID=315347 RepID=A0AAF0UH71_SOLVR|nr:hypothetical protein MTR67_039608 [Solanum verrucosum]